jgi:hypothetical protein
MREYGMRVCAIVASCALVFSLGMHTIDTNHTHPGHGHQHAGESPSVGIILSEYAHTGEKKFFAVILPVWWLAVSIFVSWGAYQHFMARSWMRARVRLHSRTGRTEDVYQWLFAKGLLHPKYCG